MQEVFGQLLLLLVAVYLIDCFRWVARGAVLIRQLPLLGAWASAPWQLGAQLRRALAFGFPLPIGSMYETEPLPLRPTPTCIIVPAFDPRGWSQPSSQDTAVAWRDLGQLVVEGNELRLAGRALHVFGSKEGAAATRELLEALRKVSTRAEKKRGAEIEKRLAARFAPAEVTAKLQKWGEWRFTVRVANSTLMLALLWLVSYFLGDREAPVRPVLAAALLAWVYALGVNIFAVRRVLAASLWPTPGEWAMALGSPLSLIRAGDLVEAELLGGEEPALAAVLLLPAPAARALLDKELRELRHPLIYPSLEPLAAEVLAGDAWLRALREKHLARLSDALPAPTPASRTPGERSCPRCLTPYGPDVVECSSCPGVRVA